MEPTSSVPSQRAQKPKKNGTDLFTNLSEIRSCDTGARCRGSAGFIASGMWLETPSNAMEKFGVNGDAVSVKRLVQRSGRISMKNRAQLTNPKSLFHERVVRKMVGYRDRGPSSPRHSLATKLKGDRVETKDAAKPGNKTPPRAGGANSYTVHSSIIVGTVPLSGMDLRKTARQSVDLGLLFVEPLPGTDRFSLAVQGATAATSPVSPFSSSSSPLLKTRRTRSWSDTSSWAAQAPMQAPQGVRTGMELAASAD